MKKALILLVLIFNLNALHAAPVKRMEIALCVDLSASTSGLLEVLRSNMWYLTYYLNTYAEQPDINIALVLYGKPGFTKETHYIRKVADLGKNVNLIQQELYSTLVAVSAKENYPEKAVLVCLQDLSWSKEPNTYRTVVVIGNGSLVDVGAMEEIAKISKKKGIYVNTIYFKTYQNEREINQWAKLAKDCNSINYMIDPAIAQPWEKDFKSSNSSFLAEVNEKYNATMIPYGEDGHKKFAKYLSMDDFARETGPVCLEFRLMYKISENYVGLNKDWDLVDLSTMGEKIDTNAIDRKLLAEQYKRIPLKTLLRVIETKKEERIYLREITAIVAQRNKMLTHDYYQEFRPIIRRSFYLVLMDLFNTQTDNYHEILD